MGPVDATALCASRNPDRRTLGRRSAQGFALEYLGDALLEQGRYDEAMRSYQAAVHAVPGYLRPYRGMAEIMLRRDHDAVRALEFVEKLMTPSRPSWNRLSMPLRAIDDYWSLKAWALAESRRGSEVAAAVAEAIRSTSPKSHPDLATTNRRLGLAMLALGHQAEAFEYFKKALEADPHGKWSVAVTEALRSRSAATA